MDERVLWWTILLPFISLTVTSAVPHVPATVVPVRLQSLGQVQILPSDQTYTDAVISRFNVPRTLAQQIVHAARSAANPVFPTTPDILAIIGIESSFRPNVHSALRVDPARGLMQVRPAVWKREIDKSAFRSVAGQVRAGAYVLAKYYKITHTKIGAVMAYNVGLTAYLNGRKNWNYVNRFIQTKKVFGAQ